MVAIPALACMKRVFWTFGPLLVLSMDQTRAQKTRQLLPRLLSPRLVHRGTRSGPTIQKIRFRHAIASTPDFGARVHFFFLKDSLTRTNDRTRSQFTCVVVHRTQHIYIFATKFSTKFSTFTLLLISFTATRSSFGGEISFGS